MATGTEWVELTGLSKLFDECVLFPTEEDAVEGVGEKLFSLNTTSAALETVRIGVARAGPLDLLDVNRSAT